MAKRVSGAAGIDSHSKLAPVTKVPSLPVSLGSEGSKRGSAAPGGGRPVGMSGVRSSMSVPPVASQSCGARLDRVIDFIESYFQRLDDLRTHSPNSTQCCLPGPLPSEPDVYTAQGISPESRLREPPHSNPLAQGEWVPNRTAFAPLVESQRRGVRGKRAKNTVDEKHSASQKCAAVKPSLTLFWLILAEHKQAP